MAGGTTGASGDCAVVAGGKRKEGIYPRGGERQTQVLYPTTAVARPEDLAATMFEALGIDSETEITDKLNRPLPIARGKAIKEVFT